MGHGLPVAAGMAIASKRKNEKRRIFVILGDGECDEGTTWETAMFANHYQLNNLTVIIDHNKMQSMDFCENTIKLEPFADKWKAFGWNVKEVDGHNYDELRNCFNNINQDTRPSVIIANTVKGKGISFMENNIIWHYRSPQGEEYEKAIEELERNKK